MCELRRCQLCAGGGSMPGRRTVRAMHHRARPPSQGVAPGLVLCHQLLPWHRRTSTAPRFWQPVPWTTCAILGGCLCVCFWSVGSVWARGHHGRPPTATPPAHHLPEKTLLPALPLLPAPATRGTGLPGWTLLRSAFSHRLSTAASGPASSSQKAGLCLSAAF